MNHAIISKVLEQDVLLPSDKTLKNYFKKYKYRGNYYVSMKSYVSKELRKKGYSLKQIGFILCVDHSTIVNLQKREFVDYEIDFINNHFENCILKSKYPKTHSTSRYNLENRYFRTFKFIKL